MIIYYKIKVGGGIMYNINIICIGKLKERYLTEACGEYLKRLNAYCSIKIIELDEYRITKSHEADIKTAVKIEGERIIKKIPPASFTIGMFIDGKQLTSSAFADKISKTALNKSSTINFIIGGSYGLSDNVRKVCDEIISLSPMTFPHQLFRIILLEQLYRAFTILNGGSYHK